MASVTLVVGDEEYLVEREIAAALAAIGVDLGSVQHLLAGEVDPGELVEMTSPSLFGDAAVVVVRQVQDANKDVAAVLTGLVEQPDDVAAVLSHAGGVKGKALLDTLKSGGARVVEVARIRNPRDREQFAVEEVARAGGSIDKGAAADLVAAIGGDLRELATACIQLVADVGAKVTADNVAAYHRGRAESTGFAVADRAVEGDVSAALETLRWAMATGLDPVLVSSSLAANLRTIAVVASAGRGSPDSLAGPLGMPAWKIRRAQGWAKRWKPGSIADAVRAVAKADADIKGAADDATYAAERAVVEVAQCAGR
jgi:DNA polymerase-3 subunit delta